MGRLIVSSSSAVSSTESGGPWVEDVIVIKTRRDDPAIARHRTGLLNGRATVLAYLSAVLGRQHSTSTIVIRRFDHS